MGQYEELLENNGAFADFLRTYLIEEQLDDESSTVGRYICVYMHMYIWAHYISCKITPWGRETVTLLQVCDIKLKSNKIYTYVDMFDYYLYS